MNGFKLSQVIHVRQFDIQILIVFEFPKKYFLLNLISIIIFHFLGKKNPLANLHSNLSPKYIGFTTPTDKLNSSAEERTRLSLRRRQNHNNNTNDTSLNIEKDAETQLDDTSFIPNNELTVGYVRRTPRNNESEVEVTPDKSTKRKEFVSPIEKLLIKNGAVMGDNNNLLLNDNESAVKQNKIQHETEDNISNTLIHNEDKEEGQQDNMEGDVKEIDSCDDDADNIDDNGGYDEDDIGHKDIEDKEENSTLVADIQKEETTKQANKTEYNKDKDLESTFHENENVNTHVADPQDNPDANSNPIYTQTVQRVAKEKKQSNKKLIVVENCSEENTNSSEFAKCTSESRTTTETPTNEEQNDRILTRMETESIETESNTDYAVTDATATVNSPSAISMDSAKGSSIVNEIPWMSFSTGDLYWGQIYTYCYWPCMVCPDPEGKTITTENRNGDQHILVHVRFFADNGRRNWVKRENLMPYTGVESYQERIEEVREKYGVKSSKYKLYVPPKKKANTWYEAVKEANIVAEVAHPNRLEKFYEIFEKSK